MLRRSILDTRSRPPPPRVAIRGKLKMIRLGLIGCGEHSEIGHAVPLARYKATHTAEVELTAVCDIRRDRAELFCRKYEFLTAYTDLDEMLTHEKLQACIAVVPVERITQLGIKLLKLGMPCVIEKPLGASLSEVKSLREAARTTATPNMVSVNRRFMPLLNQAIEWASRAGQLRYVRSTMTRHARTEPEFLWTTAVHAVDALRHVAGDIKEASIRNLGNDSSNAGWYGIDLAFESGVAGRIDILPTSGVLEETYELIGESFRAIVTSPFGPERGLRCYQENRLIIRETDESVPEEVVNGFYDEAIALIRAVSNNEPLRPSIEDVYPSVDLCLKLAESAGLLGTSTSTNH
jgi:myo-inositol 2-dehydrogenase / D-chiro-inositol 1-dehydrogenase